MIPKRLSRCRATGLFYTTMSNDQDNASRHPVDDTEAALGITAFLSPEVPGFLAVLKARYSDFIVREVSLDGSIARLTSLDASSLELATKDNAIESDVHLPTDDTTSRKRKADNDVEKSAFLNLDWPVIQTELEQFTTPDLAAHVVALLTRSTEARQLPIDAATDTTNTAPAAEKCVTLPMSSDNKQKRRELHQWIKSRLGNIARADTAEEDSDGHGNTHKVIRIWHVDFEKDMPNYGQFGGSKNRPANGQRRADNQCRNNTSDKYVRFVLYKENLDTGNAIGQVTRKYKKLRVGYAGMKDKRGITTQFVTMPAHVPLPPLLSLNAHYGSSAGGGNTTDNGVAVLRVGSLEYTNEEIRLGQLRGNHFELALRNVQRLPNDDNDLSQTKALVQAAAQSFAAHGFVNYFGTQRFGKFHDTHLTGLAVLRGDFASAVDIIMQPKDGEHERIAAARQKWLNRFGGVGDHGDSPEHRARVEAECAKQLVREFGRFMQSESAILQSLAKYPLNYKRAFGSISKTMRMMFVHAVQSFIWNQVVSQRLHRHGRSILPGDLVIPGGQNESSLDSFHRITAEDVSASRFTIDDIILPLFGSKSVLPHNECGQLFRDILADNDLTTEMFASLGDKDFNCTGDYRNLVCRPRDLDFQILEYSDAKQPLLQTDLMTLEGLQVKTAVASKIPVGKRVLGIRLCFALPSSAYATIAVRELTKRPTSSEFQSTLGLNSGI